jgi:zinc/manganese transport system ATP-binding protein/zinc transport system ATP-binding protein
MQPLIELKHVRFGYSAQPVLEEINLHLHAGQFAALVGPSGAGKTTLLKLILGTLQPNGGDICIDGCVAGVSRKLRIGYVPQLETVDWNFPVTVEQVVLMGRTQLSSRWPWHSREDRRRMRKVLEELGIEALAHRHVRDLSGGQQQRTFLARALIAEPDLLVLDEPTAGVDMRTAEAVLHMLAHLNQHGMTILMTTHDLNAAAAHAPWVICLNRTVIAQGAPEDVFTVPILNETYKGDMLVIRQDGMFIIHEKPHGHGYRDVLPNPVIGHLPDDVPIDISSNGRATIVQSGAGNQDGRSA